MAKMPHITVTVDKKDLEQMKREIREDVFRCVDTAIGEAIRVVKAKHDPDALVSSVICNALSMMEYSIRQHLP